MKKINKNIYTRVLEFIKEKELVFEGDKILLALSAGKDSMTLLDVFLHLRKILSTDIAIFHLNHMMRGKESDEDEKFLSNVADRNNIELFIHKFNFNNKVKGFSFEEYARLKRYELLDKIYREHGFQKIATAHNSDDNIETILMRIFTGTGINGLAGIDIKRDNIIRPILFLSANEIYDHLKNHNIKWREDSSNNDNKYLRNFIRNSILPEITSRFSNAGNALLSLSDTSKEYTSLIKELLTEKEGKLYTINNSDVIIGAERLIADKKLFKFIILQAISDTFKEFVSTGMLEEIYKNAITSKTHLLLYRSNKLTIHKTLKNKKKVIVISGNTQYKYHKSKWQYKLNFKPGITSSVLLKEINTEIRFDIVDYNFFLQNKDSQQIIFVLLREDFRDIILRNRRNGDRIKLEQGRKKIKDLLIDYKIDNIVKESIPLLVINSDIAAFLPGLVTELSNRVSVDFHVKNASDRILAVYYGENFKN